MSGLRKVHRIRSPHLEVSMMSSSIYFGFKYFEENSLLTIGRGDPNTHGSDTTHSLIVSLRADDGIVVEGDASSLRSTFSFKGLGTSLIMANEIMDAGKINPPRNRQSHRRLIYYHWVGSDRESNEESSQ